MRNLLLLFLCACGTDTFMNGGDGAPPDDGSMMSDGGVGTDGPSKQDGNPSVDSGCQPPNCPVEKVFGLDMPTCVRGNAPGVFWTTETTTNNIGRYDKVQGMPATSSFSEPISVCAIGSGNFYVVTNTTGQVIKFDSMLNPSGVADSQTFVRRAAGSEDNSNYIVWSRFDTIWGCGGGLQNCPGVVAFPTMPIGLDTDMNYVYATGQNPDAVYRIPRPKGQPQQLSSSIGQPTAVAVDTTSIYVSSFTDNTIYAIDKNPPSTPKVIASNQQQVRAMASDANNLYWVTKDGNLVRGPKNGGSTVVLAKNQANIWDLTVADAKYVYFIRHDTQANGGGLYRAIK